MSQIDDNNSLIYHTNLTKARPLFMPLHSTRLVETGERMEVPILFRLSLNIILIAGKSPKCMGVGSGSPPVYWGIDFLRLVDTVSNKGRSRRLATLQY